MLALRKPAWLADNWSEPVWARYLDETCAAARAARSEAAAWKRIVVRARTVLKTYSTSFYLVTRFLPLEKRRQVEVIYSVVRYPDEIVDSFDLPADERLRRLDEWGSQYETAVQCATLRAALEQGVPGFLAAFGQVIRNSGCPVEHYRAFLEAMRLDVTPRPYATLEDLNESYVYGSAIVVGYFLTYVYGTSGPNRMDAALRSARNLGIALQLTNFVRDVGEDQRRGRCYLPQDYLAAEGLDRVDVHAAEDVPALSRTVKRLADTAEDYYRASAEELDAFAADSRIAIQACINVYRQLNDRIRQSENAVARRESVPLAEKFRVLPASRYWRVPVALLWG